MSIAVNWDDVEHSIIRWDFSERWDWNDFFGAFEQSRQLAESVDHRVDVIANLSRSKWVPPSALANFSRLQQQMPPRTELIVITGGRTFDNTLIATFKAVYRINNWRLASTLENAHETIQQERLKIRQVE